MSKAETLRKLKLLDHHGWRLVDIEKGEGEREYKVTVSGFGEIDNKPRTVTGITYVYAGKTDIVKWFGSGFLSSSVIREFVEAYHHDLAEELAEKLGQGERLRQDEKPEKYKVEFFERVKDRQLTMYIINGNTAAYVCDDIESTPNKYSPIVQAAIEFHKKRVAERDKGLTENADIINNVHEQAFKQKDVCRYATPQKILVPVMDRWKRTNKVEEVIARIPKDKIPQDERTGRHCTSLTPQHADEIYRLLAIEQANATARIARLTRRPYCGHTQRNVSVVWIEGIAFWLCKECGGEG